MPFQSLLDGLIDDIPGARAALLLDATGELVMESGEHDERHRLLGAYQGIALGHTRRVAARYEAGAVHELTSRYERGDVILQPLKEGYYLVLVLDAGASLALGRHLMRPAQAHMNREL